MNLLTVSPSPHVRDRASVQSIMLNVVLALVPACIASVLIFGMSSLVLIATCVVSCVVFEQLYCMAVGEKSTVKDCSAVVTGVILAMNLPSTLPPWIAVVGSLVAIVLAKKLFGGIGSNFANPAIVARVFLLISFSGRMTTWATPFMPDVITSATPLSLIASGATDKLPSVMDMLIGARGGSLGETCSLLLIIGGIYLIWSGIITYTTPVAILATITVLSFVMGQNPIYMLLSGGTMIGAFFMATDYVTSPTSEKGKVIFGIGIGVITMLIRVYGNYPEGMSFAILLMNIVTPHIDRMIKTVPFGVGGAEK